MTTVIWVEKTGTRCVIDYNSERSIVKSFPTAWPVVTKDVRRALLARFPYGVLYRASNNEIIVAAFMDLRRDPKDIDTV